MREHDLYAEANRQLVICNACRYCEGLCPVFRAVEIRREFDKKDVFYLANLCHDCRACYYACMYTPPHPFAVNIPRLMSEARLISYRQSAWPDLMGRMFASKWPTYLSVAFAVFAVAISALCFVSPSRLFGLNVGRGSIYQIFPYRAIVIPALALFLLTIAVWVLGSIRFWAASAMDISRSLNRNSFVQVLRDAFLLRNLEGGGPGCTYPVDKPSMARRLYHSLVSWGFGLAFISTCIAAVYQEVVGRMPPYPLTSSPVIFGSVGGIAMVIGSSGLLWLKLKSDPGPIMEAASILDYVFLGTIGLSSLSGMLVLALRNTRGLGTALTIHLGFVAAMFVTAPYGKFVHFLYRILALVKYYADQNRTSRGVPSR